MFQWLGISSLNPALLWGGLAVASPIIIHLLSKRKFKILDWAAMDFLLEAEKRNRKRVKLENLLLLLLRCLIILLIALLVARPFFTSTGAGKQFAQGASAERIVILDDSPSMALNSDGAISFDSTRDAMIEFIRSLSRDRAGDTITVYVTSKPDEPLPDAKGMLLTPQNTENLIAKLQQLQPSDLSVQLEKTLMTVADNLENKTDGNLNHVVYLISDMRQHDWFKPKAALSDPASTLDSNTSAGTDGAAAASNSGADKKTGDEEPIIEAIRTLSEKTEDFVIVDVGQIVNTNLSIVGVTATTKALVQNIPVQFSVLIANNGNGAAEDVEINFQAGESVPVRTMVKSIPPGETVSVPVTFTFTETGSLPVSVTLGPDPLKPDNTYQYAARVSPGLRVLIVNGDPSSDKQKSETYFFKSALNPSDESAQEFAVTEVSEGEFEGLPIGEFQVIFLCNLFHVTDDRLDALSKWVDGGGGLAFFLGSQVDENVYNQKLFLKGNGLLPAELAVKEGDESEKAWVGVSVDDPGHQVLSKYHDGPLKILLGLVKVFQWWQIEPDKKQIEAGTVNVTMRLTDGQTSPLWVEKNYGDGRVLLSAVPLDADWHDWPGDASHGSFLAMMYEITNYLAKDQVGLGTMSTGTPVSFILDATRYQISTNLTHFRMGEEAGRDEAVPVDAVVSPDGKQMVLEYDQTQTAGFYDVVLNSLEEGEESMLFATNIDASEGNLSKVDVDDLQKKFGDANVTILDGVGALTADLSGAKAEFWPAVLLALVLVLCLELWLGFRFGRRR